MTLSKINKTKKEDNRPQRVYRLYDGDDEIFKIKTKGLELVLEEIEQNMREKGKPCDYEEYSEGINDRFQWTVE